MKRDELLTSPEWISFFKELELPTHTHVLIDSIMMSMFKADDEIGEWSREDDVTCPEEIWHLNEGAMDSLVVPILPGERAGYMIIKTIYGAGRPTCVAFGYGGHQSAIMTYFYKEEDKGPNHSDQEEPDESMDGDHATGLASAGFGTDEDYGGTDEQF